MDVNSRRNGMELTRRPDVNPARAEMKEDLDETTSWIPIRYVITFDDTGNNPRTGADGDATSNMNFTNNAKMRHVLGWMIS